MHSKLFLAATITLLISLATNAQTARQPFDDIGKEVKVLSLTNGKYEEFFDNDSLQRIGTALVNINTMKVVKLLLSEEEERIMDNSESSRFLSVDPLSRSYPELTPYQFASNTPIAAIDLDGLEGIISTYGMEYAVPHLGKYTKEQTQRHYESVAAMKKGDAAGAIAGPAVWGGVFAYPYVVRGFLGIGAWASRPENQQRVADVGNFGVELLNPDPTPLNPGNPGGELSRLLKGLPKLGSLTGNVSKPLALGLGKVKAGFLQFSGTHNLIDYENWGDFFKFGKDALVDWSAKFSQSISETIEKGGKIIFNLDGVEKSIAQKGFGSFVDAKRAVNANGTLGQVTEWELSQILRNEKWLNNTTFVRDGEIVDAAKEDLKFIK